MNIAKKVVLISPDVLRRLNKLDQDNSLANIKNDMLKVLHDPELKDLGHNTNNCYRGVHFFKIGCDSQWKYQ